MAYVNCRHFVSSTLVVVLAALAGCAKQGEENTLPTAAPPPSTSANPLTAIEEHTKSDAAVDVYNDKLSAFERESYFLKRAQSVAAASLLSSEGTLLAQASSPDGAKPTVIAVLPAALPAAPATTATVPPAGASVVDRAASAVQQGASQAAGVVAQGAEQAASAAAPVVSKAASAVADAASDVSQAASGIASQAASAAAPAVAPAVPVNTGEDAIKREFILAAVEPVMRLNAAVYLERNEIVRIRDRTVGGKDQLHLSESDWLMRIKARYQLAPSDGFDVLLARVDGVKLPFLIAPLALVTGWKNPQTDLKKLFADRIESLNTSASEENVRFRTARAEMASGKQVESVPLMNALLGTKADGPISPFTAVIHDINRVSEADPAINAKIQQVYQALLAEIRK